ncbi:MAG TPA: tRNA (adenosine(37)-N6)-threonylcarbamoyltransferase complex ATPase subunit type 1 TsaE [Verrucomicrobiae bacterium]|nr:tRNA (adenosine(37)-N6)-threonylcarbamoyltransferase complex ATPase subunit type 1 TsaE [Verrucomicrobiae bacterium]
MKQHEIRIISEGMMRAFGKHLAHYVKGGDCLELVGDVGAGKTTFVKGLGEGLGITEDIQSPSFTISRVYQAPSGLELHHYDFYRLPDAGVLEYEFAESLANPRAITVVEWADVVHDILPTSHIRLKIVATGETNRRVGLSGMENFEMNL